MRLRKQATGSLCGMTICQKFFFLEAKKVILFASHEWWRNSWNNLLIVRWACKTVSSVLLTQLVSETSALQSPDWQGDRYSSLFPSSSTRLACAMVNSGVDSNAAAFTGAKSNRVCSSMFEQATVCWLPTVTVHKSRERKKNRIAISLNGPATIARYKFKTYNSRLKSHHHHYQN